MCGITGFLGFEDKNLLKRMCDVVEYRGPDDSGTYTDGDCSLGHRRLSIIDLAGGHQPMHNEDESVWIVYNGEIYNHLELREDLEKKGHRFYTRSDTETIIHAYEEYGDACVERLRGMFAFAIWDSGPKKLFLAKDRLGIKPLYYYFDGGRLIFGSEIKSILQCPEVKREVNYNAIDSYLAYRFVSGESTILKGIKKLPPANVLTWQKGNISIKEYWNLQMNPGALSEDYYLKNLKKLLKKSVELRLMSEVPLGVYLSGGLDSSLVVGIMSHLLEEPVKTFSVGFGDPNFDEVDYAMTVAEHFETDHHEFIVEPNAMELFPKIIWHFDEPIADPALFPTYLLSEKAKEYVTVVLTGEGGDELFAGYEQYKIMSLSENYGKFLPRVVKTQVLPKIAEKVPKNLLNMLFRYSSALGEEGIRRFSKYMSVLDDKGKSYLALISVFDDDERDDTYTESIKTQISQNLSEELNRNYFTPQKCNTLNRLLYLEIKTSLQEHLLMKVDKMTMAHSIEARVPLLDHVLAEFSGTMPQHLKLNGVKDKYVLRKAASDILPREIFKREKQRFFVPIHSWLEGESKELAMQILDSSSIKRRGYFKHQPIERMFEKFQRSRLYYSRQIWSLMALELWHRIYIDSDNLYRPDLSLDALTSP